jgi:dipeptidyl aminopeptidase/acylaminoacyl peptidase
MESFAQSKPFGLWESPVSAATLSQDLRLTEVNWAGDGSTLLWLEGRSGFGTLLAGGNGEAPVVLNPEISCMGGVGYGGGEFSVHGSRVYFVGKDGRLYARPLGHHQARPITPSYGGLASPAVSPDGEWVVCVFSDGTSDFLIVVDSQGKTWPQKLAGGADFYMQPSWHPKAKSLAWVEWDHPHMPWDQTRLMLADVNFQTFPHLGNVRSLAEDLDIVIVQPAFSPDGKYLSYLSTHGNWDAIMLYEVETGKKELLYAPEDAHLMEPAWVQGMRAYAWLNDSQTIIFTRYQKGIASLWTINIKTGERSQIPSGPYTYFYQISVSATDQIAAIASSAQIPPRVVIRAGENWQVLAKSSTENVDPQFLSTPIPISWPAEDQTLVHGLYFPPANPNFSASGKPPAIVHIHGGPTSQAVAEYNKDASYFTSRGYGWLEVNYRGSSGYGHDYERLLRKNWGNLDVEDAVSGARALVSEGLANEKQLVIMGGSAGGYTVYNCLIRYPGVFKAGVCLYGVSNLFTLDMDSHKFETHYNASMIGNLPEAAGRYQAWSPVFHAAKIKDALAIFQGSDDKAVPPNQAEEIIARLQQNGIQYFYRLYAGEGHGFRKNENIQDFYQQVERFLQQNVLFAP